MTHVQLVVSHLFRTFLQILRYTSPLHNYFFKMSWEFCLVVKSGSCSYLDFTCLAWDTCMSFAFGSDYDLNINGCLGTMDTSE
jgi:hypothetical protein